MEIKVWELTTKMGKSSSLEDQLSCLDRITDHIKVCGWTHQEFKEETLRRVDANWDSDTIWN